MGMKARTVGAKVKSTSRLKAQLDKLGARPDLQIVFAKAISKGEIRRAEKELGISLPDAYTDFVHTHGPLHFRGLNEEGRHVGSEFNELLSPEAMVSATREWKKLLLSENKSGGEIAPEVIENFVVFFHDGACNVAVFCPAKTLQGKTAVYMVYHDSLYVEWPSPSLTFETFLREAFKES
jgi:cell wall assembly regulator SMI1